MHNKHTQHTQHTHNTHTHTHTHTRTHTHTHLHNTHTNTHESLAVRCFRPGTYTLVQDQVVDQVALDAVFCCATNEIPVECGGQMVYMDEENELLSVPARPNSLSLTYRDRGTMRFVKYLNHHCSDIRYDFAVIWKESEEALRKAAEEEQEEAEEEEEEVEGHHANQDLHLHHQHQHHLGQEEEEGKRKGKAESEEEEQPSSEGEKEKGGGSGVGLHSFFAPSL